MTTDNDDSKNSLEPDWESWAQMDCDYDVDTTETPDSLYKLPKSVLDDTSVEEEKTIYDLPHISEVEGTVEVKMGLTLRSAKELVNSDLEIPCGVPTFVIDVKEADDGVILECFPIRETVRLANGELRTAEAVRESL